MDEKEITFMVGATKFVTSKDIVTSQGDNYFSNIIKYSYDPGCKYYFIPRDANHFKYVLDYFLCPESIRFIDNVPLLQRLSIESDYYQINNMKLDIETRLIELRNITCPIEIACLSTRGWISNGNNFIWSGTYMSEYLKTINNYITFKQEGLYLFSLIITIDNFCQNSDSSDSESDLDDYICLIKGLKREDLISHSCNGKDKDTTYNIETIYYRNVGDCMNFYQTCYPERKRKDGKGTLGMKSCTLTIVRLTNKQIEKPEKDSYITH